jgi:hypothetical protein
MNLHLVFEDLASKLLNLNSNPRKQQKDAADQQKEENENASPLPPFFNSSNLRCAFPSSLFLLLIRI